MRVEIRTKAVFSFIGAGGKEFDTLAAAERSLLKEGLDEALDRLDLGCSDCGTDGAAALTETLLDHRPDIISALGGVDKAAAVELVQDALDEIRDFRSDAATVLQKLIEDIEDA